MEKLKRSHQEQPFWSRLLFGTRFNFYSPYSIEDCADILLAHSERRSRWLASKRKLLVTVNEKGDDTYIFRMHRDVGRNLNIEVLGTLTRDGVSTHVEGRARIGLITLGFCVVWLTIWTLASIAMHFYYMTAFGFMVVGSMLLFSAFERDRLGPLPREILGKPKEKRDVGSPYF